MTTVTRRFLFWSLAFLQLSALCGVTWFATRPRHSPLAVATEQIPEANRLLSYRGKGLMAQDRKGFRLKPDALERVGGMLAVELPARTEQPFLLGSGDLTQPIQLQLAAAESAAGIIEAGRVSYASVYPDIDIIAVADGQHLELAYLLAEARRVTLRFSLKSADGKGKLMLEPATGAVVLRAASGKPALRVERPLAIDAAGATRTGSYRVDGDYVDLDLDASSLQPPILIDPLFALPLWTILADERAPGDKTYAVARGSRETHVVYDPVREATVLVRPSRSQQSMDRYWPFGLYSGIGADFTPKISPLTRTAGRGATTPGFLEQFDWNATARLESETWEWRNGAWSRRLVSGLPGLIDPAITFDPSIGQIRVLGGQVPLFACWHEVAAAGFFLPTLGCEGLFEDDMHRLSSSGWERQTVAGLPTARVRGAMIPWRGGLLLFGGREYVGYNPYPTELPFPDNLTSDVLNDTWVFDGRSWLELYTANPPPAREAPQLILDERRGKAVLVGGVNASGKDAFDIWELDGTDWIQRVDGSASSTPQDLRNRTNVAAAWSPAHQATLLFGGNVPRFAACSLTEKQIQEQVKTAQGLAEVKRLGCLGGYSHDLWSWDGTTLKQLTTVAFGGEEGSTLVFREAVQPPTAAPAVSIAPASAPLDTHLLPWRYDRDKQHYQLRSELERAYLGGAVRSSRAQPLTVQVAAPMSGTVGLSSPLFGTSTRPNMVFDTKRSTLVVFTANDGRVFERGPTAWADRTPNATPFSNGPNELFAATWDPVVQRILLFDPVTGKTWQHTDAGGWQALNAPASPPSSKPTAVRAPRMTYDIARQRAVMFHGAFVWELIGNAWQARTQPNDWSDCKTTTMLAYDRERARTVLVGCTIPAQTYEWDGSQLYGPGPSPYTRWVLRDWAVTALDWVGTLQPGWGHPNALFESRALHGVSTFDADGRVNTWNGSSWVGGPALSEGANCDWGGREFADRWWWGKLAMPGLPLGQQTGDGYMGYGLATPGCFFPPTFEDANNARLVTFRDGARGMREYRFADGGPTFKPLLVGHEFADGARVHPHPRELVADKLIALEPASDPKSRFHVDNSKNQGIWEQLFPGKDDWRAMETGVSNRAWPFQIFPDPVTGRVRVLTQRGAIWELGAEQRQGIGEPCQDSVDCLQGACVAAQTSPTGKICCDAVCGSTCTTCEGTKLGHCEARPRGTPDPGCSGSGDCGKVCSGELSGGYNEVIEAGTRRLTPDERKSSCAFVPRSCGPTGVCQDGVLTAAGTCADNRSVCLITPETVCAGGLACQNATSCKTKCTSPADCKLPNQICSADGASCMPDGKVCHNTGECPRFHDCAPDGKSCSPDRALVAASAFGVAPSPWQPPPVRSPEQIAALLKRMGYPEDAEGRILIPGGFFGGTQLAFNPKRKDPVMGMRACQTRILACVQEVGKWGECVAGVPRCQGATPWLDDAAGADCCPVECLSEYFENGGTYNPEQAMSLMRHSDCYPGLRGFLEGLQP